MRGKSVVITGATAGIGRAAAIELARRGAHVVLVARNDERAKGTVATIEAAAPDASVRWFLGDLASLASVRSVATELEGVLGRIDVLVNNAGIAAVRSRTTDDGFDEMLATNYLGPFLLTHLLLDRVRAAAPSRIVVVGSEAHRVAARFDPERFEDLGTYSGITAQFAYGRTKLLDILMADELARRLPPTDVTVNSLCPGLVATELGREAGPAQRVTAFLSATPVVRTPEQGARIIVHLADSDAVERVTGRFFSSTPGAGLLPKAGPRRTPTIAARVYERTCDLLGIEPLPPRASRS